MKKINKNADALPDGSVFSKSKQLIVRCIDGETVLLDLNTGIYYSLESVGGRIWDMIDGRRTVSEIAGLVAGEYDVTAQEASSDLRELFSDLIQEGLILKV